jgi:hypothetical protein
MKHWPKLAALLAVVVMLLALVAVSYAAPTAQTATPAPKAPATNQDPAKPVIPFVEAWQKSPHADVEAEAFAHWDEEGPMPAACAKCHSSEGYMDFVAGEDAQAYETGSIISCVACHNADTVSKTSVVFPSGIEITNLGDESRCMVCHQGRESKISVDRQITTTFKLDPIKDLDTVVKPLVSTDAAGKAVTTTFGFRNVHYFAAAATQYGTLAKGGYEYDGQSYDGKFDHPAPFNTCIGCHDPHALEMDLEACATCHEGVESAEDLAAIRMAGSLMDYDGDGDAEEGIGEEYAGLQELLGEAITAYAKEVSKVDIIYNSAAHPYWFGDANANGKFDEGEKAYAGWTPRLLKAAYNYQVASKDPGAFAHNAKYAIQLMHDSIADLNTKIAKPVDIEAAARNDAGHFDGTSMAFRDWDDVGEVPAGCAKCHSATGLPEFIKNAGTVAVTGSGAVQTVGIGNAPLSNGLACTTCHDDLTEYTLYQVKGVPFPSGKTVSFSKKDEKGAYGDAVADNLCLECHQGRASTASVNGRTRNMKDDEVPQAGLSFINVHYFAAGASLFGNEASGAYEYAEKEYAGRFMHVPGFDTCTGCHNPHELGLELDKCTTCHAGVEEASEIRIVKEDLDGDKDTKEGAQGEILTLQEKLFVAIQDYAKTVVKKPIAYDAHAYPYFFNDTNSNGKADADEAVRANGFASYTPRLLKAAYNYQYSQKDPGIYAHNLDYAAQFLYDSLEDLGKGGVKVDVAGLVRPEVEE